MASRYFIVDTTYAMDYCFPWYPLRWRHNDHAGVSNHQPHGCLLNRLFRRKSKKTSKLRVTGLCAGNSPGDRWISRTNGQLRGKCFHLMTSSCVRCHFIWTIHSSCPEKLKTWADFPNIVNRYCTWKCRKWYRINYKYITEHFFVFCYKAINNTTAQCE